EAIDNLEAELLVRFLAAFETQLDPDFHVVRQELDGVIQFGLEVVGINVRAELNLLHPPAGGFVAFVGLGFLVEELSVVDDAADGRSRGSGDLNQIKLSVARQPQGSVQAHYAKLLLFLIYHPHFARADLGVSAMERFVPLKRAGTIHLERISYLVITLSSE